MKAEETVLTTLLGAGLLVLLMVPLMESHAAGQACECLAMDDSRPVVTARDDNATRCGQEGHEETGHADTH